MADNIVFGSGVLAHHPEELLWIINFFLLCTCRRIISFFFVTRISWEISKIESSIQRQSYRKCYGGQYCLWKWSDISSSWGIILNNFFLLYSSCRRRPSVTWIFFVRRFLHNSTTIWLFFMDYGWITFVDLSLKIG